MARTTQYIRQLLTPNPTHLPTLNLCPLSQALLFYHSLRQHGGTSVDAFTNSLNDMHTLYPWHSTSSHTAPVLDDRDVRQAYRTSRLVTDKLTGMNCSGFEGLGLDAGVLSWCDVCNHKPLTLPSITVDEERTADVILASLRTGSHGALTDAPLEARGEATGMLLETGLETENAKAPPEPFSYAALASSADMTGMSPPPFHDTTYMCTSSFVPSLLHDCPRD
jgi:hypothetical protein